MSAKDAAILAEESYDVCLPGTLPADQVALVETIHRKFLQVLGESLTEALDIPVKTDLIGVEQCERAEFAGSCDPHGCRISLPSSRGPRAILDFTPGFLHRILAILIGAADQVALPERSITGIERHIVRECLDRFIEKLREAWAAAGVRFEPVSFAGEADKPLDEIGLGAALVITSIIHFGAAGETFRLAVPPLLIRLAAAGLKPAAPPPAAGPVLLNALNKAALQVEAILGGPSLRMRDVIGLAPGKVLMLGAPGNCSVECVVNGVPKFRGELVSSGRNQAFQIDAPIESRSARTRAQ